MDQKEATGILCASFLILTSLHASAAPHSRPDPRARGLRLLFRSAGSGSAWGRTSDSSCRCGGRKPGVGSRSRWSGSRGLGAVRRACLEPQDRGRVDMSSTPARAAKRVTRPSKYARPRNCETARPHTALIHGLKAATRSAAAATAGFRRTARNDHGNRYR